MKYIFLSLAILLISCKGKDDSKIEHPQKIKIDNISQNLETLLVKSSNDIVSELKFHTNEFEFDISPDSSSIIVNSRILSNIQISELYCLDNKGRIDTNQITNLSTGIWDSLSSKYKFDKEAILFPMTMAHFSPNNGAEIIINAKGQTELGLKIDENIELRVPSNTTLKKE